MGYDNAMLDPVVILEDIRSAHNVGAIFRTADAVGVSTLYLAGYTPAPVDRFGRPVSEVCKTALGATDTVAWEQVVSSVALVNALQAKGVYVVAVEQTATATDIYAYQPPLDVPAAYVFGNEITGVSPEVLQAVDAVVQVPMRGKKESLNVSVTVGIILFLIRRTL